VATGNFAQQVHLEDFARTVSIVDALAASLQHSTTESVRSPQPRATGSPSSVQVRGAQIGACHAASDTERALQTLRGVRRRLEAMTAATTTPAYTPGASRMEPEAVGDLSASQLADHQQQQLDDYKRQLGDARRRTHVLQQVRDTGRMSMCVCWASHVLLTYCSTP